MRIFVQISYNGTAYSGWQIQENANSIQQEIEYSFSKIFNSSVQIAGSSRTDTGVHARGQFAHTDIPEVDDLQKLQFKLNSLLPPDISIDRVYRVRNEGHSRFDAISRSYEYKIAHRKDPFLTDLVYFYSRKLDVEKMNEAAKVLIARKDFQSFSKVKTDVNNYVCEISDAYWDYRESILTFFITSNRFLRGMVRAITGTLIEVGLNKLSVQEFSDIIEAKDRRKAGRAVPACGLFLTEVKYPEGYFERSS
ncbi:MAG: tRNA pseudouridine(38-40) synthase TruA [Bacteroidota bacterium]